MACSPFTFNRFAFQLSSLRTGVVVLSSRFLRVLGGIGVMRI